MGQWTMDVKSEKSQAGEPEDDEKHPYTTKKFSPPTIFYHWKMIENKPVSEKTTFFSGVQYLQKPFSDFESLFTL